MSELIRIRMGIAIAVIGVGLLILEVVRLVSGTLGDSSAAVVAMLISTGLVVFGSCFSMGLLPKEWSIGPKGASATLIEIHERVYGPVPQPSGVRELTPDAKKARDRVIASLPGAKPGDFRLFEAPEFASLQLSQTSETVMYTLDESFRIVDWNRAFSLAFDFTMEGRRGQTVAEWVFFLANRDVVAQNGVAAFKGKTPDQYPSPHVEQLVFQHDRYGEIKGMKRAFKIHDDNQKYAGWVVTVDVTFQDPDHERRYRSDLLATLRNDLLWSEYALCYDVLEHTQCYPELLDTILGKIGNFDPIPANARVLDLGAGSGNICSRLMGQGRVIFAVENNPSMLARLKEKCKNLLRYDDEKPGVIPVRQDISSLEGIPTDYFDYAILNNVLYAIDDPGPCLKAVYERLRDGGQIRLSGPHKDTVVETLLDQLRRELDAAPARNSSRVNEDFEILELINKNYLKPKLCRWSVGDMETRLEENGFRVLRPSIPNAYAGQAMVICAQKNGSPSPG